MVDRGQINAVLDEVEALLRFWKQIGISGFQCSEQRLAQVEAWDQPPAPKSETLETIRNDLGDCRRCTLAQGRSNIVFGVGSPRASLMFIGEGPGYDEDRQGIPFVGAAGKLLTRIIEAMQLSREAVYIANIVKCRPPGNRNPQQDEVAACLPFLKRQIESVRPQWICVLGKVAAQTLLDTQAPISSMRGRWHEFNGIPVMPTYHPAYLLRNPDGKKAVWSDMQLVMKAMGIRLNKK
jgi:DNA polymerase